MRFISLIIVLSLPMYWSNAPIGTPTQKVEGPIRLEIEGISFSKDVLPFFQTKCNFGECHGKTGKAFPKYRTYSMIKAKAKKVVKRLKDDKNPMPPEDAGVTVTKEEIAMLEAWIEAGYPKN